MAPIRALVVGGTAGIGKGIALALAKRDVEVTIAGRSAAKGNEVVAQLTSISPDQKGHKFVSVDGFDLSSVRDLATTTTTTTKAGSDHLNILVMTQGMATIQGYTPTVDKIDQKLQLHYFSRMYLASLVAPHMKDNSKILTVLSAGVHSKFNNFEQDFDLSKSSYSIKNAADAAGFYTDAGFEALSEKHPNLVVAHASPGFVNTDWGTEMPTILRAMIRPLQSMFAKSLEDCGETMVGALMDLPKGFSLVDDSGNVIPKEKGLKHTEKERDFIYEQTLKLLPDILE